MSAQFTSDTNNDGLLGLAFSRINTVEPTQQTTFFDTVKSSLAKKLFTVDLKKVSCHDWVTRRGRGLVV